MSSRSSRTLYVGNLPGDTRMREVEDLFYKVSFSIDLIIYNFRGTDLLLFIVCKLFCCFYGSYDFFFWSSLNFCKLYFIVVLLHV